MSWLRNLSVPEQLALKPGGFYRIETTDRGQILSIHQPGQPVERYLVPTAGLANQLRQQLTDQGMAGFVEGSA